MDKKLKRGRPATGRKKTGVLYLRLPEFQKETVKKLVEDFLAGRIQRTTMRVDSWVFPGKP